MGTERLTNDRIENNEDFLASTGVRVPQSGTGMLQYRNWDAECRNTDASGTGLDADAQLWILVKFLLKLYRKVISYNLNSIFCNPLAHTEIPDLNLQIQKFPLLRLKKVFF